MGKLTVSQKRFLIALPLGILFGFLCSYFASSSNPGIWWTPLMWTIVSDRFVIGIMVGLAGVYMYHPVLKFRCIPLVRGAAMGIAGSLPMAFGAMTNPPPSMTAWSLFFASVITGAIYGMIIDVVATKWGGEGKALIA